MRSYHERCRSRSPAGRRGRHRQGVPSEVMRAPLARGRSDSAGSEARRWMVDLSVAIAVAAVQVGLFVAAVAHRGGVVTPGKAALLVAGGLVLVARRQYPVAVMVAAYAFTLSFQATQDFGANGGPACQRSFWLLRRRSTLATEWQQ